MLRSFGHRCSVPILVVALVAVATPGLAVPLERATFVEILSGGGPGAAGTSRFLPEEIDRFVEIAGGVSAGHAKTTGGAQPSAELSVRATARTRADGLAEVTYQFGVEPLVPGLVIEAVPVHVSAAARLRPRARAPIKRPCSPSPRSARRPGVPAWGAPARNPPTSSSRTPSW